MSSCTYLGIKTLFDWEGRRRERTSIGWNGNDQGEIDHRSNTNYYAAKNLEKLWVCKHKNKGWNIDMFRESWPLCDCLLMPNGPEENPDFILHPLQWPKHMKCPNKTKTPAIYTSFLIPPNEKEYQAQRSNEGTCYFKVLKIERCDKILFSDCANSTQAGYLKIQWNIPLTNWPWVICASQL